MTRSDVLGWVASGVFLVRLTPQPFRLARSGVADGVSPLGALNAVVADVAWFAYGLGAGLPVVWVVSLIALVPQIWAVVLLRSRTVAGDVAWAAVWGAVVAASAAGGTLATTLALGVVVTQGPHVWRACVEPDLRGIAPATWWLSMLDAATWGAYGAAVGDPALGGYAVVLAASAVVVLGRVGWTRRRVGSVLG